MRRQQGFTLIEVMVAVAILGIVIAIAIPSYRSYVETSRQEAMLAQVQALQFFQNSYFVDNGTYVAGTYDPNTGTNSFAAVMAFRIDADKAKIKLVASAGSCGTITRCYIVTATDNDHHKLVWTQTGSITYSTF